MEAFKEGDMRLVPLAVAFSALSLAASAVAGDSVLLASRRGGWIEAINLETLETVSRIRVPEMAESIASDASGQRLFVTAPRSPGKGCCALFALDPQSMRLSFLVEPALSATVTAGRLFTQRGNIGIEAFDLQDLNRLPTIKAPGVYRLRASPDGRLLVGLSNWPQPSLDLFDAVQGGLIASQRMPEGSSLAGAWLGRQYFLLAVQSGQAMLRPVNPDSGKLGEALSLSHAGSPAGSFPLCQMTAYDVIASGGRLAIYGQFGSKSDGACTVPGGFVVADPRTGAVTDRFASDMSFRQMAASPDGLYLYGLDVGSPEWRVRIVKMEARTGQVVAEKRIDSDVWNLTMGQIPHEMQGHLDLTAILPPRL
jgi:hypothetical protein